MIDDISSVGFDRAAPAPARAPIRLVPAAAPAPSTPTRDTGTEIPATPPSEVLDALDKAQQVLADYEARKTTLRFDVDSATKQVTAQLIGSDGKIIREIPAKHGLDLLTSDHVVDALG
jgi:hypothetical protein